MKKFITLLLLFSSIIANSQRLKYTILKDEPDKIKNATFHIDPFYADAWSTNTTLGWGLRADLMLKKRISANVFFKKAYLDMNARSHFDKDLVTPKRGFKKLTYFEPVVSYHLIDKLKKKSVKVVISSSTSYSGSYKTTTTKYIMVPGTVRKIRGVRGGFYFLNSAIDMNEGDAISSWVAKKDSSIIKFGGYDNKVHGSPIYNGYTQMNQIAFFGGITFKSITNLQTKIEGYRKTRGNYSFYDFYFDLMFAPVLSYQDIKFKDGSVYNLKNNSNKRTGWRTGLLFKFVNKPYMSYGFELGQRPGFVGNKKGILNPRTFLNITMGISIPYNLKFIK
ncbi:MAG: hypothetical protein HUU47_09725 [Bacteroidetes bacterium]|nr:hypothetical protein [Bacteroidota bacterium]